MTENTQKALALFVTRKLIAALDRHEKFQGTLDANITFLVDKGMAEPEARKLILGLMDKLTR